jgi:hypothetical protein
LKNRLATLDPLAGFAFRPNDSERVEQARQLLAQLDSTLDVLT